MKKLLSLALTLILTMLTFVGCGADETAENSTTSEAAVETSSETASVSSNKKASSKPKSSSSKKKKPSSKKQSSSEEDEEYEYEYDYEVTFTPQEEIYYGVDPEMYKTALKNKGNSARIAALMKKAQKGGNYKIAVLGGSISRGAGSSGQSSSYGSLVCSWWKTNFPKSNFTFINAGFGSTNPEMACYRMGEDLIKQKPDFVIVDFNVNTYLDQNVYNTYSTILYSILSQKNSPAVMSIEFTSCVRSKYEGWPKVVQKPSDAVNEEITAAVEAYDIPTMSYHNYIWKKIDKKVISWDDIGSDYIHPNDNGHLVAANLINAHLDEVLKNIKKYSGKITAPQKPSNSAYLNLGYIINTTKGITMNGGFSKRTNDYADGKGWAYTFTSKESSLTIPVPENKGLKVFMKFNSSSTGSITVTDSNDNKRTISSNEAATPTLVDIGKMSGKITFTTNMTSGGFEIYGIGVRK